MGEFISMKTAPEYDVKLAWHPIMRKPRKAADRIWKAHGQADGVTVTAGTNGDHGAGSWHYCGCAEDYRTRFWDAEEQSEVFTELRAALPGYDVVWHDTHIHVEPGDALARKWGLML